MIITLVSVEYGRLTATAKGCLKPNAKLRYAAVPLNFGEYVLVGNKDRYIVKECGQIDSFLPITSDLPKYYAATMILDYLQKMSQGAQPQIFLAALHCIKDMAYNGVEAEDGARNFMLAILESCGSGLDFKHCGICKCTLDGACAFSQSEGIVCTHCQNETFITIDSLTRAYLSGENEEIPKRLKAKANMLLSEFVNIMLGIKISNHYFTEQI